MKVKPWKACALGLFSLLGLNVPILAQVPPPPPAVIGPVAPAPAAPPGNLWGFLKMTPEQRADCKERYCNSAIGKVIGASMQPMAALSGGLLQDRCALPSAAELALPPDSAGGAAARIKADELEAQARRIDVRYLGTVDCSRWPEAEEALILSLRGDRNECVRYEAALALGRGCCCTPKTVAALSITVSGASVDGFPVERSERVRAAAAAALDHCLFCLAPHHPLPPLGIVPGTEVLPHGEPKELPPPQEFPAPGVAKGGPVPKIEPAAPVPAQNAALQPASYYKNIDSKSVAPLVQYAKKSLNQNPQAPALPHPSPTKTGGLVEIVTTAFTPTTGAQTGPAQQVRPTPTPAYHSPTAGPLLMQVPGNAVIEEPSPKTRGLLPMLMGQGQHKTTTATPAPAKISWSAENDSPYTTVTPAVRTEVVSPMVPVKTKESPSPMVPVATLLEPEPSLAPPSPPAQIGIPIAPVPASLPVIPASSPGAYLCQPRSIDQILKSEEGK